MQTLALTDDEIAAWLRLIGTRGAGSVAIRRLLGVYGLPQYIFKQSQTALAQVVGAKLAEALKHVNSECLAKNVARVRNWMKSAGNHFVTLADPAYPRMLLEIADPPAFLYVKGRLELLHAPSLAIVGSRNGTPQGLANAKQLAHTLAHAGLTIVSGLALGIDGAAHRGALSSPCSTIAVVGTGIDLVYPARHHALAHEIATHGALVSEWPLSAKARAQHFPQRNRLIAGLTQGVLVVEAALQSGSLITARLAGEMGREVFALPGSIHSPLTKGCHRLIKEGAKLVECAQDILDEIRHTDLLSPAISAKDYRDSTQETPSLSAQPMDTDHPTQPHMHHNLNWSERNLEGAQIISQASPLQTDEMSATLNANAHCVLAALNYDPTSLELLATRTKLNSAILQATLLQLELGGWITALPGGRVERIKRDAASR
ncbi:SMF protein [Mycoavidus cysteinexigens]|uniref:SMF protein n=1 Tax=Mycoavidus cysteinexigens TaxID=1553431 RepID=A0A2Z6EYG4_9BURK|nr:DNA-processing protein DprA [Mycoavidus cysteinexigens]BBE10467.1 SMF protein [Mycoavidus cysteinexigens]GAM53153.1 rossmann fold nucleotide-binding protein Smf possibly involved in DNA uptake [bacterium endosymbiont of Mortierella elongata FMR23-6]GLR01829.1 DNA processing protein DprA [Mycoavidus cysteinexigens]